MAERERETIITTGGRSSGGSAVAIVAIVLVLLVALFFLFGRGMLSSEPDARSIKADVDVNVPATGSGGTTGGTSN